MDLPKMEYFKENFQAMWAQISAIDPFEGVDANAMPELRKIWNDMKADGERLNTALNDTSLNANALWENGLSRTSEQLINLDPNASEDNPAYDTQQMNKNLNSAEANVRWRLSQIGRSFREQMALMNLVTREEREMYSMIGKQNEIKDIDKEVEQSDDGFAEFENEKALTDAAGKAHSDLEAAKTECEQIKQENNIDESMLTKETMDALQAENDSLLQTKNQAASVVEAAAAEYEKQKTILLTKQETYNAQLKTNKHEMEQAIQAAKNDRAAKQKALEQELAKVSEETDIIARQEELNRELERADAERMKQIRDQEDVIFDREIEERQFKAQLDAKHEETEKSARKMQSRQKEIEEEIQKLREHGTEVGNGVNLRQTSADMVAKTKKFFDDLAKEKQDFIAIRQETKNKNTVKEYRANYYAALLAKEDTARTCNKMQDTYGILLKSGYEDKAAKMLEDGKRLNARKNVDKENLSVNDREALRVYRAYLADKNTLRAGFNRHGTNKEFDKKFQENTATLAGLVRMGNELHALDKAALDNMFIKAEPGKELTELQQRCNAGMQEIADNYTTLKQYSKIQSEVPDALAQEKEELADSNKRLGFLIKENDKLIELNKKNQLLEKQAAEQYEQKKQLLAEARSKLKALQDTKVQAKADAESELTAMREKKEQAKIEIQNKLKALPDAEKAAIKAAEDKCREKRSEMEKILTEDKAKLDTLKAAKNEAADNARAAETSYGVFLKKSKPYTLLSKAVGEQQRCEEQHKKMTGLMNKVSDLLGKQQTKKEMLQRIQDEYGFTEGDFGVVITDFKDIKGPAGIAHKWCDDMVVAPAMRKQLLSTLKHYDATADVAKEKGHDDSDAYKEMMRTLRVLTADDGAAMKGKTAREVKELLQATAKGAHDYIKAKEDQWFQSFRHSDMRKTRLLFAKQLEQFCKTGIDVVDMAQIQKSTVRTSFLTRSGELRKEDAFTSKDDLVSKLHKNAVQHVEKKKQNEKSGPVHETGKVKSFQQP